MTLNEFCEKNPQLKRPQFLRQELIDKANSVDLEKVNEKIHASGFLLSRRWLPWILERIEDIQNGVYCDYERYEPPKGSLHTKNERHYTDEELDKMILKFEDIDF